MKLLVENIIKFLLIIKEFTEILNELKLFIKLIFFFIKEVKLFPMKMMNVI